MIAEADSGGNLLNVVALLLAAACAVGFFWFLRKNMLFGLAFALAGAAVLAAPVVLDLRSTRSDRPFMLVIANDRISETGFLTREAFKGGRYHSPDNRTYRLEREPEWPSAATLIVNDSPRLLTVRRFLYLARPSQYADSPLMAVVFPGGQAVIRGYPYAMQNEGTAPPETLKSSQLGESIDIVYRTLEPYDPAIHGTPSELTSAVQP
ncbi:hypothetical protein [Minwuia thermotolerans]|uniref:hypothetical protein n=1 Tax=Minwuia thermotolerans TaxID=2056226 RepID=UPI000D6DC53E|nr:hypothetical protein [Minwuia thermotolerans]